MSGIIEEFIKTKKKFCLHLLINTFKRLNDIQSNQSYVDQDDIQQGLYSELNLLEYDVQLSNFEINAHTALILETILIPLLSASGQIRLQIGSEYIDNCKNFLYGMLNIIFSKCGNLKYPLVEEFCFEVNNYLQIDDIQSKRISFHKDDFAYNKSISNNYVPRKNLYTTTNPNINSNSQRYSANYAADLNNRNALSYVVFDDDYSTRRSSFPTKPSNHNNNQLSMQQLNSSQNQQRIEFEKSEPIVRLLAQVRKVGMDIIFPQQNHDKILACIFVVLKCTKTTPAHRELIDLVMALKRSDLLATIKSISKTKIRGVLALLKHGKLLVTQGDYGEPVRLGLMDGISTFQQLREHHDIFLDNYMTEQHLFIPSLLRNELLWHVDEATKQMRLEAINKLIEKLEYNFTHNLESYLASSDDNVGSSNNNDYSSNHQFSSSVAANNYLNTSDKLFMTRKSNSTNTTTGSIRNEDVGANLLTHHSPTQVTSSSFNNNNSSNNNSIYHHNINIDKNNNPSNYYNNYNGVGFEMNSSIQYNNNPNQVHTTFTPRENNSPIYNNMSNNNNSSNNNYMGNMSNNNNHNMNSITARVAGASNHSSYLSTSTAPTIAVGNKTHSQEYATKSRLLSTTTTPIIATMPHHHHHHHQQQQQQQQQQHQSNRNYIVDTRRTGNAAMMMHEYHNNQTISSSNNVVTKNSKNSSYDSNLAMSDNYNLNAQHVASTNMLNNYKITKQRQQEDQIYKDNVNSTSTRYYDDIHESYENNLYDYNEAASLISPLSEESNSRSIDWDGYNNNNNLLNKKVVHRPISDESYFIEDNSDKLMHRYALRRDVLNTNTTNRHIANISYIQDNDRDTQELPRPFSYPASNTICSMVETDDIDADEDGDESYYQANHTNKYHSNEMMVNHSNLSDTIHQNDYGIISNLPTNNNNNNLFKQSNSYIYPIMNNKNSNNDRYSVSGENIFNQLNVGSSSIISPNNESIS